MQTSNVNTAVLYIFKTMSTNFFLPFFAGVQLLSFLTMALQSTV